MVPGCGQFVQYVLLAVGLYDPFGHILHWLSFLYSPGVQFNVPPPGIYIAAHVSSFADIPSSSAW